MSYGKDGTPGGNGENATSSISSCNLMRYQVRTLSKNEIGRIFIDAQSENDASTSAYAWFKSCNYKPT
jgi:hypothetical protein